MRSGTATLATRLGKTVHVSPLDYKLRRLQARFPAAGADCVEDWLVDLANARGFRVVERQRPAGWRFSAPPPELLSAEELVVAICHLGRLDRPQMLRLAAQMISGNALEFSTLRLVAERERAAPVLAELARQALKVDPHHDLWRRIAAACGAGRPLREPILHWTRLAEPVMVRGQGNAQSWHLVA